MTTREHTLQVRVGQLTIGGGAPVRVQSMTKTDTRDVESTVEQIRRLQEAGCELVRLAIPDGEAAEALGKIRAKVDVPLVADIHFDWRLALGALRNGADKLRLNPGNIGSPDRVRRIAEAAKERGVPIRIGVNAGSLEKRLLAKFGRASPEAMVESALGHIRLLEDLDFRDIVISLKAFDVPTSALAYQLMAETRPYPLHVGITEAGTPWSGTIRSAVGIGLILGMGIGDTLRVSLTGDPVEEVRVGYEVLKSLGLRERGPTVISCPGCGRCEIDLATLVSEVERELEGVALPIKVAVMGCVVNGPGEAREADVGLAGGKGTGLIFRKGSPVRKVSGEDMVRELCREIRETAGEGER